MIQPFNLTSSTVNWPAPSARPSLLDATSFTAVLGSGEPSPPGPADGPTAIRVRRMTRCYTRPIKVSQPRISFRGLFLWGRLQWRRYR